MPDDRLLDGIETATEVPFIPGPDEREYLHAPLTGFDYYPYEGYDDSERQRVAMLGQFSVGSNFISRIVTSPEQRSLGISLLAAEAGLVTATNYIDDQIETFEIPQDMIKRALSLDQECDEVRLVAGIQVYYDADINTVEPVLILDARLRRLGFFVGGTLLSHRSEAAIKQCDMALDIVRETAASREDLAIAGAISLLKPALDEYRLFFDSSSDSLQIQ